MSSSDFFQLLQQATSLTRAGDVHAATAAIRQALATPSHADAQADAIDVEARWVNDPALGGPPADVRAPDTGRAREEAFVPGRFSSGSSARDFKLYIPASAAQLADVRRPLVVMLHGCTQDPDDFAAGTQMNAAAREHGLFVLYPAQSRKANPQGCWNWFKRQHQARGRGEPALIAGMVEQIARDYPVDRTRIYVAGLSAGGAMAAILAQAYPDLFAAVGVHSGLAAGAAQDLPSALAAMKEGPARSPAAAGPRVPTFVVHGDADKVVHPRNGDHLHAQALQQGAPVQTERGREPSGHAWTRSVQHDAGGTPLAESWVVHGAAHAWSGGNQRGSYTDPKGPDATAAMVRFFLAQRPRGAGEHGA